MKATFNIVGTCMKTREIKNSANEVFKHTAEIATVGLTAVIDADAIHQHLIPGKNYEINGNIAPGYKGGVDLVATDVEYAEVN